MLSRVNTLILAIFVIFIFTSCSGTKPVNPVVPSDETTTGRSVQVSPVTESWWNTSVNVDGENWTAHMDEFGRITRALGKGVKGIEPVSFIDSHNQFFGVNSDELILKRDETHDGIRTAIYRQGFNGIEIENTLIRIIYGRGGSLVSWGAETWSGFQPQNTWTLGETEATDSAKAYDDSKFISTQKYYYAKDNVLIPSWRIDFDNNSYMVSAVDGSILETHQNRYEWNHDGHITGEVKPWSPLDANVTADMYGVKVGFYYYDQYFVTDTYTNPEGKYHWYSGDRYWLKNLTFSNPWIHVEEAWDSGIPTFSMWEWSDANYFYETYLDDSNSQSGERNLLLYGTQAHDWIWTIEPEFNLLNFQLPCFVDKIGACTAYAYCGGEPSIHFFQPWDNCTDTGDSPTIISHEYGHIYVSRIYYSPSGALHEALADTFSNCISRKYTVGPDLYGAGTYRRVSNNERKWPAPECDNEVHCVGNVLAGAFWNLRESVGDNLTDNIFHYTNYMNTVPFNEKAADVMLVDDDDDDITNGCPHYEAIYDAFYVKHNLSVPSITNPQTSGVVLDIVPLDLPHTIPYADGGQFRYHLKLRNLDNVRHTKEIWAAFEMPNGSFLGPILPPLARIVARPATINLQPYQVIDIDLTQQVPKHVPLDTYYYHVRVGDFVDNVNDVIDDEGVLEVRIIN